jgi:hypothetical protein
LENLPESAPELVRLSPLAVISAMFALVGTFLVLASVLLKTANVRIAQEGMGLGLIVSVSAVGLATVAVARIALSHGRLVGYAYVAVGAGISLGGLVLMVFLVVTSGVKSTARRMTCGTNLSGIGKATLIYAHEYDNVLPRAGGPDSTWGARTPWWPAEKARDAYGLTDPNATDGKASVSACLYLLVKYNETPLKSFVCRNDEGTTEFEPADYGADGRPAAELWDFGPNPPRHCSYAYQMVHCDPSLTTSAEPGLAIAADRSPWIDGPVRAAEDFSRFVPGTPAFQGTFEEARHGNSTAHEREGQNVLFLDSHVEFTKRSYWGIQEDNIYTSWKGQDRVRGIPPELGSVPAGSLDSLLVNDPAVPQD